MKKLLLIKTGAFGDIVLVSVSINIVSKFFADYEIYLLTALQYKEIYKNCRFIKEIFSLPPGKNPLSFFKFIKSLRKRHFDLIFDLQGNLKTNFYSFLLGGKKRIGLYKKNAGKFFLTRGIKKSSDTDPVIAQIELWKKIVGTDVVGKPEIWISDQTTRNFDEFLEIHGLQKKNYIVFHPSASPEWETKLWLIENWISLGKILSQKGFPIVLIGDKNAIKLNSKILASIETAVDFTGKTDFFQLALLIKHSKCLITTDSGPMHVGAAVGTETIAIFGPTNPALHCPQGVKAISAQVNCSPCYRKKCDRMDCMELITPEKIVQLMQIEKELRNCIIYP